MGRFSYRKPADAEYREPAQLAEEVIKAQEAEIAQMKAWLANNDAKPAK